MAQLNIAGWSSSVARRAYNPKVVGSNPAPCNQAESGRTMRSDSFLFIKINPFLL